MSSFDSAAYWAERGKVYEQQAIDGGWWDGEQEGIPDLLATLTFESVLEVGCGFGRVGASIKRHFPEVAYTGIDISSDLVEGARKRLPDSEIILADAVTWEDDREWDLVLAISALSHIPSEDIAGVTAKLKQWARRDIVVVDWNQIGAHTPYQHSHDIEALLGRGAERVSVKGPGQSVYDGRLSLWHLPMSRS